MRLVLTNSMYKAFCSCPKRAMAIYEGRITGNKDIIPSFVSKSTLPMAAGSLGDAIITCGFKPDIDADVAPEDFSWFLKSSYDDGTKNAILLCNQPTAKKRGGWNAAAKKAINAAYRLMEDPKMKLLMGGADMQCRMSYMIDHETEWQGDLDILNVLDGVIMINDIKLTSDAVVKGGYIQQIFTDRFGAEYIKNVRTSWENKWFYWAQLNSYRYGIVRAKDTCKLNGIPLAETKYAGIEKVMTGLSYATREEVPSVGYRPIADSLDKWVGMVKGRIIPEGKTPYNNIPNEPSMLERIKLIATRQAEAPACGKAECDYCKPRRAIEFTDTDALPEVDYIYGVDKVDENDIWDSDF